jgi:pimeloyl-ACP methyl ester carboxylesterase
MRLADPLALHRTATGLARGTTPTMRRLLERSTAARVHLQGELSGELDDWKGLEAAGVRVVTVPGAGHNIMFDRPDAFVAEVAATV